MKVLLLDLDGVLRRFGNDEHLAIERHYDILEGRLRDAVFDPALALPAVRGESTRGDWIRAAAEAVGSIAAARELLACRGRVDPDVLAIVREARSVLPVGLLTNATDTLAEELDVIGLAGELDHVFASCRFGLVKPEPALYRRVCAELGVAPHEIAFTDDQAAFVHGAQAEGWNARHFDGAAGLRRWLEHLGVLAG